MRGRPARGASHDKMMEALHGSVGRDKPEAGVHHGAFPVSTAHTAPERGFRRARLRKLFPPAALLIAVASGMTPIAKALEACRISCAHNDPLAERWVLEAVKHRTRVFSRGARRRTGEPKAVLANGWSTRLTMSRQFSP